MKEHRHAEVLRAIADGKDVQCRRNESFAQDAWEDMKGANPISNDYLEWRVKPEPKPDFDLYIGFIPSDSTGAYVGAEYDVVDHWNHVLKITIDGETNQPKAVELLK